MAVVAAAAVCLTAGGGRETWEAETFAAAAAAVAHVEERGVWWRSGMGAGIAFPTKQGHAVGRLDGASSRTRAVRPCRKTGRCCFCLSFGVAEWKRKIKTGTERHTSISKKRAEATDGVSSARQKKRHTESSSAIEPESRATAEWVKKARQICFVGRAVGRGA